MKEVFTHFDSARVGLCKSLLEEAGIACFVRNEAGGVITTQPFYPSLCVVNDADEERAKQLIADKNGPISRAGGDWICPHCRSSVPAGFEKCWNCERERGE